MDKVQRIIASIDRISFTFIALKLLAIWGSLLSYGGYSLQFAKFKNFIYDFLLPTFHRPDHFFIFILINITPPIK